MEPIKKYIPWIIIGIIILWGIFSYNGMVNTGQGVSQSWADVESAYQRRSDLIPNLVATVKGYAKHEESTLTKVVEARAGATQVKVDPSNITPEQLEKFQQAQAGVGSALSRLLAVSENYPDLKANQNFLDLQSQLEGTENRINVARNRFNLVVKEYNSKILRFPGSIIAMILGFKEKAYFKAAAGTENAPEVKF